MNLKSKLGVTSIGGDAIAVALKSVGIRANLYEQGVAIKEVGVGMRPPSVHFFKY